MRKLVVVLALLTALVPAAALAGGWATVKLSSSPKGAQAGVPWVVDLTVLQHGVTPLDGLAPVLTITNGAGDWATFTGTATGKPGVYRADVVFPAGGTWKYSVWDDFSQTHTFNPVEVAAPGSFPLFELALGIALAIALAAATIVLLRRSRRAPQPIGLGEPA